MVTIFSVDVEFEIVKVKVINDQFAAKMSKQKKINVEG